MEQIGSGGFHDVFTELMNIVFKQASSHQVFDRKLKKLDSYKLTLRVVIS